MEWKYVYSIAVKRFEIRGFKHEYARNNKIIIILQHEQDARANKLLL